MISGHQSALKHSKLKLSLTAGAAQDAKEQSCQGRLITCQLIMWHLARRCQLSNKAAAVEGPALECLSLLILRLVERCTSSCLNVWDEPPAAAIIDGVLPSRSSVMRIVHTAGRYDRQSNYPANYTSSAPRETQPITCTWPDVGWRWGQMWRREVCGL